VRLLPPSDDSDPVSHFLANVNDLFEHAFENVGSSDMVGITIQNRVNQNDKPIGFSFRRKDQLSGDVIWSVFEKVSQSNSTFDALDKLVIAVHSVKMPIGFGKNSMKTMGRPLSVMAHHEKSIIEVKAADNCLTHTLIIAIAIVDTDSNCKSYRDGWKIRPVVRILLETKGIDLSNGTRISELVRYQEHFRDYKIMVYKGLSYENIMFEGQVESSKRINLLYDDVNRHCHVITNLTAAMARRYVCKSCSKGVK